MSIPVSKRTIPYPEISLNEVSMHDTYDNCWIVLFNKVYDLTEFVNYHPGGAEVLFEQAGRDATLAFQQAGHQTVSDTHLEPYRIGTLLKSEWFDLDQLLNKSRDSLLETPSLPP